MCFFFFLVCFLGAGFVLVFLCVVWGRVRWVFGVFVCCYASQSTALLAVFSFLSDLGDIQTERH